MNGSIIQYLINGVFEGSVYAMIAVGLSLIFGILEVVNFAHGEFYMLGAVFLFVFFKILGMPYWIGVILSVMFMAAFGVLVERLTIRPLIGKGWLLPIIATFALSLGLQNFIIVTFGSTPKPVVTKYANNVIDIGGIYFTQQRLFILIFAITAFVLLHIFLKKTKTGKAMRAISQNRDAAQIVGIDTNKIYMITFAIGSGLAGLAGAIVGPIYVIYPTMGALLSLKAFACVIMGGF
ncbi:branched-chain amino acid ABC transporter permease, partial [Thermococci archaeon]